MPTAVNDSIRTDRPNTPSVVERQHAPLGHGPKRLCHRVCTLAEVCSQLCSFKASYDTAELHERFLPRRTPAEFHCLHSESKSGPFLVGEAGILEGVAIVVHDVAELDLEDVRRFPLDRDPQAPQQVLVAFECPVKRRVVVTVVPGDCVPDLVSSDGALHREEIGQQVENPLNDFLHHRDATTRRSSFRPFRQPLGMDPCTRSSVGPDR